MDSRRLASETVDYVLFSLIAHGSDGLAKRAAELGGDEEAAHVVETFASVRRTVEHALSTDDEAALLRFFDEHPEDFAYALTELLGRKFAANPDSQPKWISYCMAVLAGGPASWRW